MIIEPFVIKDKNLFRMYFNESDFEFNFDNIIMGRYKLKVYSAVSTDGKDWKREDGIRLDTDFNYSTGEAYSPFVLKERGKYHMLYSGCWGIYFSRLFQVGKFVFKKIMGR